MIKPASDIVTYTVPSHPTHLVAHQRHERKGLEFTGTERILFVRYTKRCGIVLVTSYPDAPASTKCECMLNNVVYNRWYKHTVSTTRQAALLVNRFLADLDAEVAELTKRKTAP